MAMTLLAGLALYSCGSDSKGDDGPGGGSNGTLEVTPESKEISHAGGEISVSVKSDGYWSIKADQNWVSFDPMRGSQNGSFKVKVEKNSTESKRQVAITVSDDDQGLKQSFTVEQGPLEANPQNGNRYERLHRYPAVLVLGSASRTVVRIRAHKARNPDHRDAQQPHSHHARDQRARSIRAYRQRGNR